MVKRKRLYFDIETSYMICKTFYIGRKVFLDHKSILHHAKIICICWKWEGGKMGSLTWDGKQDDKKMLEAFIRIANSADEIVAQNGDAFDIRWLRTRCIFHRIPMFPSYTTIDTLKAARSKFRFPSNRLDFMGGYLGVGNKIKTDGELWDKVILNKCPLALKKMVRYCKQDVALLENIHQLMNPYLLAKTHYGVLNDRKSRESCPECGSSKTRKMRKMVSATGSMKQQYVCGDCGKYHTETIKNDKVRNKVRVNFDKVCNK
jgi:hypothetical protein